MLKKSNYLWALPLALIVLLSCDSNTYLDVYETLPDTWHKDSIAQFKFKAPDTLNNYNLYINLRNNNAYQYNNLFLIVALDYPNGKTTKDTLEYKMAAPDGKLLGKGLTDVKQNKLWYKGYDTTFKFTEQGNYTISIQHAMRKNGEVKGITDLDGISEIGFSIETQNN